MLEEFKKYYCLGTPNYFLELFTELAKEKNAKLNEKDLYFLFYNRIIDGRFIIDGGIRLALYIGILKKDSGKIFFNKDFALFLENVNLLREGFVFFLFKAFKKNNVLPPFFDSKFITYDIVNNTLQIDNAAFRLEFSNFKQLFLDFGIIIPHPKKEFNSFLINPKIKKVFDDYFLPLQKKRRISLDELELYLKQQQIYGEEAEKFVIEFENIRLKNVKRIIWVSPYNVNEGYDVLSYNLPEDENTNRFIEVKSYEGNYPYFYWTKNEIETSRLKGQKYWIYLVNRREINCDGYIPIMIQNPYKTVLNHDDWIKEVEKYKLVSKIHK